MIQPKVYVLGLGSIGTFAAHSLAEIPQRPAVTLLLHRESLLEAYTKNGNRITLETKEGEIVNHDNYDFEVLGGGSWYPAWPRNPQHSEGPKSATVHGSPTTEIIENLIISVKATQTIEALKPLKNRLTRRTTIVFLQNGSGMIETVNEELFPNEHTRPNYIIGVITHGVNLNAPFNITHTGGSTTSVGPVPRQGLTTKEDEEKRSYLLKALPQAPRLTASAYNFETILQLQLEKLTINAICNPICALNDCQLEYLLTIPNTRRSLITEITSVILALPELAGVPGVEERFSVDTLEAALMNLIYRAPHATPSMVWDLRGGRQTEIMFINGYWCRRGKELGVKTPGHDELVRKVLERSK